MNLCIAGLAFFFWNYELWLAFLAFEFVEDSLVFWVVVLKC